MKLLIATSNPAKLKEYRLLLKGFALKPCRLKIAESGESFKQNAILKARACGQKYNLPALADDSGLEIKALRGFPGVRSARFAKGDFKPAMRKILARLERKRDRRARFVCVLALFLPDSGKVKTFTGMVSGIIADRPRGQGGFGYDPIFIYPGPKMKVSHRAKAVKKFLVYNQNHGL